MAPVRARARSPLRLLPQRNVELGEGDGDAGPAEGVHKEWTMKREKKSPAYTTRWTELPVAT